MNRQVFFSFHYSKDVWRVAQVRNMGVVEGQDLFFDNGWEQVRKTSESAIKKWIDHEMNMRSCVVVLIGEETASRDWVKYEIQEAWKKGKGIVGIYIHNLEDQSQKQSNKGENPFDYFCIDKRFNFISNRATPLDQNEARLSSICKTYDSIYSFSQNVYNDIKIHINDWIEEAIAIRNRYPK